MKPFVFNVVTGLFMLGVSTGMVPPSGLDLVKTQSGPISGTLNKEGNVHIFRGIPYAAAPVGPLRWKAPQPVAPWKEVRACNAFSASPMQPVPAPFSMWSEEFLIPKAPISEDCLYLNVWTGAKLSSEKRPVMVWIYGGGFSSGGSAVPIYDGEAMAKKGIVFVSINYRVGVFGFFSHPELTDESGHAASGNYGLLDQVAALQWVQKNIAAFGGDPKNVTIAGQSAGSMSVNCLVASPLARNLFKRAIAESGARFVKGAFGPDMSLSMAEKMGLNAAKNLHAGTLGELRKIPAEELLKNVQGTGPIVDGYVLPESIGAIFASGRQNPVDLLTGWNQDEGLIFGPIKNAEDYKKDILQKYGDAASELLRYYPGENDAQASDAQLKLSRDMVFGVQNYTWANQAPPPGKKVFVYRFTRKVPATGEYKKYGAFHTGEVPYAYDNLQFVNRPWEPVDHSLATVMSAYWANFARTGDPNGKGLPAWPGYDAATKKIMLLGEKAESATMPDADALDFLFRQMSRK